MRLVREIIDRTAHNPAYITGRNRHDFAPFALFDAGEVRESSPLVIDWHPHSGVATITFPYGADLHHQDSSGNSGVINDSGLQWMASGRGIWHKEGYYPRSASSPFGIMQLWLLLPPGEEVAETEYFNLQPNDIPRSGNTRVLLGEYGGVKAAQMISHNVTYLDVSLRRGDTWNLTPAARQVRGFVYPRSGQLVIAGREVDAERLALLEESGKELVVEAREDTEFVVAMTEPWPHNVIQHYGQIHTNQAALAEGAKHIRQLGQQLFESGELRWKNNGSKPST
ncbi:pirin family protein [Photobacterium sp. OFAV2-7]|uniref:pirin family protein n=1 Tax=Photobacterium sp. OFAV2-7 TaxID=2917748 RepID=UPI001EF667B7|nr:pirin family protein [Photobacterium sp. OFAV2-7]MCG7584687.1 pirin family protein [Photobacterium sp. OFAV2-7]